MDLLKPKQEGGAMQCNDWRKVIFLNVSNCHLQPVTVPSSGIVMPINRPSTTTETTPALLHHLSVTVLKLIIRITLDFPRQKSI